MKPIALLGGAALLAFLAAGCNSYGGNTPKSAETPTTTATTTTPPSDTPPATTAPDAAAGKEVTLAGGLKYTDLKVGDGDIAEAGMTATVHYTGWLTDGTKFDSSVDRGQPFPFRIGAGNVIKGWDQGVVGMRIGGKRHLVIPPDMGYGPNGMGPIPPNSTLVFDVELLGLAR